MVLPEPRPRLHVMSSTWINDPNGLVVRDGVWHAFFQHNPDGPLWGNMSWGHATSSDLVHWHEQPVALWHDADHACFSGSAVVDEHDTAGFGAGSLVAIYTSHHHLDSPRAGVEAQSLAHSSDGVAFTKVDEPVLDRQSSDFRDPKVFWDEPRGRWVMVAVEAIDNAVLVHHSPDLHSWTLASEFRHPDLVSPAWECPDLFPLTVGGRTRWVLIVSVNPGGITGGSGTRWFLGDFDGETFTLADDDPGLWLDWGSDNYAAVSVNHAPDGRRVMLGWHNNWQYSGPLADAGFPGMLTAAREVSLVDDGDRTSLVQWPVAELLACMGDPVEVVDGTVPAVCWIEVTLTAPQHVTLGQHTLTWADDTLVLDRSPMLGGVTPQKSVTAPLRPGLERLELAVLLDHGSLEIFADGGRTVLSSLALDDVGPRSVHGDGPVEGLVIREFLG